MRYTILAALILTLSLGAQAQRRPSYAEYHSRVETIRNIKVDLKSHKNANRFRTNLRNAAKDGVNFGGHYILTGWGCGTNCSEWAIIDARNGRVFFPREFEGVGFGFCDLPEKAMPKDEPKTAHETEGPLYWQKNSRLIVLTGMTGGGLDDPKAKCGNYFFEWTGTALRRVGFIAGKRTDAP